MNKTLNYKKTHAQKFGKCFLNCADNSIFSCHKNICRKLYWYEELNYMRHFNDMMKNFKNFGCLLRAAWYPIKRWH